MIIDPHAHSSVALGHATHDDELLACFPAMSQLRPRLTDSKHFVATCRQMEQTGYRILAAWNDDATVLALAGYRLQENFVFGRFVYVNDLVTIESARGRGLGARLIAQVSVIAVKEGASRLVLDTGLANTKAQRFYFRAGLLPLALTFSSDLENYATEAART
jgi:ribosomal protein S18 acetylase RimI-like enzyme